MPDRGKRWGAILLIVVAAVALLGVARVLRSGAPPPSSPPPGIRSAIEACHLPASDPKAGGPLSWQLAVRLDSPAQTDMLFVSGWTRLTCTTFRTADGTFDSATTAMGGSPSDAVTGDALTYEEGTTPSQGGQYPAQLVVGRMPKATARIEVATSDGQRRDATLGDGWYMAYAATTAGTPVTDIVAYDVAGKVIARLADPGGLQPGATPAAS